MNQEYKGIFLQHRHRFWSQMNKKKEKYDNTDEAYKRKLNYQP
jgi:hypothetical protein